MKEINIKALYKTKGHIKCPKTIAKCIALLLQRFLNLFK